MKLINKIGFMQGRLSPMIRNKLQAFPFAYWQKEFEIANSLNIKLMEWTIDNFQFEKNPIIKNIIDFMVKVKTDLEYDYYYNCKELYNIINNYIELSLGKHNYQINKLGFNGKMCILFDKQLNDGRFYPFYNEIPLLSETNSLYPYP